MTLKPKPEVSIKKANQSGTLGVKFYRVKAPKSHTIPHDGICYYNSCFSKSRLWQNRNTQKEQAAIYKDSAPIQLSRTDD